MRVTRHRDPAAFRQLVDPHLRGDAVRHNLIRRLLTTLIERSDVYPRFHLWAVLDGDRVVGAALRTEPHNLVIAAPAREGAIDLLVDALVDEQAEVPGVIGGRPEADTFVTHWTKATGTRVASRMDQAIHVLTSVHDVPAPSGAPRAAGPDDLELVVRWNRAFESESSLGELDDTDESVRRRLLHRITNHRDGGYRIWEDGAPMCLVGFAGVASGTPSVGPVYTPPPLRRRGYGTALTAAITCELLSRGASSCLLYTDLANPTSNAIYARIGYRRVCDSAMVRFG